MKAPLLLAALFLTACANTPDYDVYVSPDFTAVQAQGVQDGMRLWETAASEVHMHEKGNLVVRVYPQASCPYVLDSGHLGFTFQQHVICLNTARIDDTWIARVTAHELGHVMGLGHVAEGSIMTTGGGTTPAPTPEDVANMRRVHGG